MSERDKLSKRTLVAVCIVRFRHITINTIMFPAKAAVAMIPQTKENPTILSVVEYKSNILVGRCVVFGILPLELVRLFIVNQGASFLFVLSVEFCVLFNTVQLTFSGFIQLTFMDKVELLFFSCKTFVRRGENQILLFEFFNRRAGFCCYIQSSNIREVDLGVVCPLGLGNPKVDSWLVCLSVLENA